MIRGGRACVLHCLMRRPSSSPKLAVILAGLAFAASAQEPNVVEGVVRQETTKQVLAGVAVTIRFGGGNQVHRARTDDEGRFRLEVPGTGSHEMSFTLGGSTVCPAPTPFSEES